MKDAEAALLQGSPTMSTISSDCTDQTYLDSSTPNSPMIVGPSKKNLETTDLQPTFLLPRRTAKKPGFRLRPPYFMLIVSLVEVAVYLLDDGWLREWLVYDPRQRLQAWRLASYMLLHSDSLHLALNVLIQLLLAVTLEAEQGRLAVVAVYLGGGLCGALGSSLLQPRLYLIGASAGVYALLTSHLAHLYLCHGELRYANWRLLTVALLAAADVVSVPVLALTGRGRVGWGAHLASAVAGPLLGLACFPRQSKRDTRGRRFVRFVRLCSSVSLVLLVLGGILGNAYLVALPQLKRPS